MNLLWYLLGVFIGLILLLGNALAGNPAPAQVDRGATAPVTCNAVVAKGVGTDNARRFSTVFTTEDGAAATSVTYDFGDGITATTEATEAITHTYAMPGTYDVIATINAKVDQGGNTTQDSCRTVVTIP